MAACTEESQQIDYKPSNNNSEGKCDSDTLSKNLPRDIFSLEAL